MKIIHSSRLISRVSSYGELIFNWVSLKLMGAYLELRAYSESMDGKIRVNRGISRVNEWGIRS